MNYKTKMIKKPRYPTQRFVPWSTQNFESSCPVKRANYIFGRLDVDTMLFGQKSNRSYGKINDGHLQGDECLIGNLKGSQLAVMLSHHKFVFYAREWDGKRTDRDTNRDVLHGGQMLVLIDDFPINKPQKRRCGSTCKPHRFDEYLIIRRSVLQPIKNTRIPY